MIQSLIDDTDPQDDPPQDPPQSSSSPTRPPPASDYAQFSPRTKCTPSSEKSTQTDSQIKVVRVIYFHLLSSILLCYFMIFLFVFYRKNSGRKKFKWTENLVTLARRQPISNMTNIFSIHFVYYLFFFIIAIVLFYGPTSHAFADYFSFLKTNIYSVRVFFAYFSKYTIRNSSANIFP